ncbi:MAG: DNA alkylation repair protein [Psychromonas sp.]
MAEPFKNLLNRDVIAAMAIHFQLHESDFDSQSFINEATQDLELLELKQRTERITATMIKYFPDDFGLASKILYASLGTQLGDDLSSGVVDKHGIAGWAVTPLAHYVAVQGEQHFELSMDLLKEMTKCASSEFSIRFFIIQQPEKTLRVLNDWVSNPNQHVRRLVSEGSRPRLPWAMRLPIFINDPNPVILLLEKLKDDQSEYVRRSVANNLNDIAKDHPDLVAELAERWMIDASQQRIKLIRHACRTLIKNGHKKTLTVFGYKTPALNETNLVLQTATVKFGEALHFSITIDTSASKEQALLIDYVIHHQKANGKTTPKVFKLCTANIKNNQPLIITKKHPFKQITTRKYYAGLHYIEIMINGVSVAKCEFNLFM